VNILSLAGKNLQRRRGRTVLTVTGVAIAIAVLFSLLAFNAGYEQALTREMEGLGVHMLAVPKGCPYEAASLIMHGGVIPKYLTDTDVAGVQSLAGIDLATPMLLHQFVKNGTPHIVYGIQPTGMLQLKPTWKVEGRFFEVGETNVMVVGRSLAEREGLSVGSVLPFGKDQEPFTVVGILEKTGGQDDEFHFAPLADVQRVFALEGQISAIGVRVTDISAIPAVSLEMEKIPDIQVVTMAQVTGTIMSLVGAARTLILSVIVVALVISASGITNTLLMSVNERTREFGVMKAIGASGTDIARLVLTETLIITGIGGVLGTGLAIIGGSLIEGFVRSSIPYAPAGQFISLDPVLVVACILFSLLLGLVCGLYPAVKSSRLTPMEAIRSEFE
jgi:putative ABC transport system permease protein